MKIARPIFVLTCLCCSHVLGHQYVADLVAGTGAAENNGDAGPALKTNIGEPFGVTIGPDDALYITEVRNHRVRRLDVTTDELTTVAGCGQKGYSGDGGPAIEAKLNEPYEIRFDQNANMYVVEMQNHVVRRIDDKTKFISTVAGGRRQGFGGDGGPAINAQFSQPHSIALNRDGAIFVADIGNHRIRRIDPATQIIDSIAGAAQRRLPRDGQVARGNPILGPRALFIAENTLWIALREGNSIWRLDLTDGVLHHVAGTGEAGFSGDGGPAERATLNGPKGIAVGRDGNVFIADTENHAIRMIDRQTGLISTIAGGANASQSSIGQSELATNVRLNRPHGICVAVDGSIYVGDTLNHRIARLR